MTLLVDYGGLDKATAGKASDYYTNDYPAVVAWRTRPLIAIEPA